MSTANIWYIIAVTFFIIADYITGVAKAIMQHNLNSGKMREGLGHKFAYFMLALVAWFIDTINLHVDLGLPISVFVCTISGISLIELTSILENIMAVNPELANTPLMQIFSQNTSGKHKAE